MDYVRTQRFFYDDVDFEPAAGLYNTLKTTLAAEKERIGDQYYSTVRYNQTSETQAEMWKVS